MKATTPKDSAGTGPLNFQRPLATVDVAIFTIISDRLHVLLVQRNNDPGEPFPNKWALAGGFVD
ncbi:MAG TPA: NUDIX domain-containing protein, partial [Gallionella sp.]|nr:NUDIX domain-containing protein [Gallionella sp.]